MNSVDKQNKSDKKKDHEPTSAEISMKAKQGKQAFVDEDDEEIEVGERKASTKGKDKRKRT